MKWVFLLWSQRQHGIPKWFHKDAQKDRPQLMTLKQPLHSLKQNFEIMKLQMWQLSDSITHEGSTTCEFLFIPLVLRERIKDETTSRAFLFTNNPWRSIFMAELWRGWVCLCVVVAKTGVSVLLRHFNRSCSGNLWCCDVKLCVELALVTALRWNDWLSAGSQLSKQQDEINTNTFIWVCHWFRAR